MQAETASRVLAQLHHGSESTGEGGIVVTGNLVVYVIHSVVLVGTVLAIN